MKKSKIDCAISVVVISVCLVKAVLYGGSKPPSSTNEPPADIEGDVSVATNEPPEIVDGEAPTNAAPPVLMASRPWLVTSVPPSYQSQSSYSSQLVANWTARGAYCDWQPITFSGGFRFPVGTNFIDGVTLMSWGELRQLTANSQQLTALPQAVSLEPNVSSVTHGLTPSNSYLFAWTNCCVERCATNRVNASFELFRSGACSVRFDNVETFHPAPVPSDYPGIGQDDDWVRATFPDEADNILALGYESWLTDEWVGVNEQNGRYKATVTIAALPADGSPCYLTCGPYRVNVVAPGTYSFPLEVFESYHIRTYPTAVPLSIVCDDGYTGEGVSLNVQLMGGRPNRPRLLAAPSQPPSDPYDYTLTTTPNVIVTPARIPLSTANGSTVSIWCKIADAAQKTYEAVSQELYLAFFGSEAEIHDAFIAERVEIIMRLDQRECRGEFEIYDDDDDEEEDEELPEREDDSIFSGESLHSEVSNDCVNVYLTGVTAHDSTMTNLAATAYGLAEGQSADVFVYMATSESGDDQYDDSVGWTVTANGTVGLQGESSVSEHADAVGGSTYGVTSGAVLLASGHFSPPSDDILRLRLQCWARNVGDEKKETCVQIVVVPRE